MKILKNKVLIKLIASLCVCLTLFNFTSTVKVYAEDDQVWGSVLLRPITSLMTAIGDSIMDIVHDTVQGQKTTLIKIQGASAWENFWNTVAAVVVGIVVAVAFTIAAAAIAGIGTAALGVLAGGTFTFSMASIGTGTTLAGILVGTVVGITLHQDWFPKDIYLPIYTVSAEEIFSNKLALFDVNFFNPRNEVRDKTLPGTGGVEYREGYGWYYVGKDQLKKLPDDEYPYWVDSESTSLSQLYQYPENDSDGHWGNGFESGNTVWKSLDGWHEWVPPTLEEAGGLNGTDHTEYYKHFSGMKQNEDDAHQYWQWREIKDNQGDLDHVQAIESIFSIKYEEDYNYPTNANRYSGMMTPTSSVTVKSEKTSTHNDVPAILSGSGLTKTDILNSAVTELTQRVYTIEDRQYYTYRITFHCEDKGMLTLIATYMHVAVPDQVVQETILSTAAQLKGVVTTWYFILRNLALVVLMLLLIYSGIRIVIGSTAGEKAKYKERLMDWLVALCLLFVMHYIMAFSVGLVGRITDLVNTINQKDLNAALIPLRNDQLVRAGNLDWSGFGGLDAITIDHSGAESGKALVWQTNIMGLFRIQAQLENEGTGRWVGYSLCFVILVLFTLFFSFTYVKRVLYMAFLTIIAPLVAMTYPIDKITDGKAQAFDAWIKEYIFNLMIQPLHLLLYSILVLSAFELTSTNAIYALVAIGFMMPAEKLMRRFFGFEKAKTPGLLGGAAGAAIAMSGLQSLMKGGKSGGGKSNGGTTSGKDQSKVKFARSGLNQNERMQAIGGTPSGQSAGRTASGARQTGDSAGGNPIRTARGQQGRAIGQNQDNPEGMPLFGPGDDNIGELDEDSILANTTLGATDWDHDGFGADYAGETPEIEAPAQGNIADDDADTDTEEAESHRSIKGAIGAALLGTGKQVAGSVLRGIHPLKLAGKIATGATAATAGLLLGIASGDPNKAFQYTTAGAVAGSALAGSLSGGTLIDTEKLKEDVDMAYYGEDYKKHLLEKEKKAFEKNKESISYLKQTMGVSEERAKQILSSTGAQCFNQGITNIEDIATIHQLTTGGDSVSFNQAVAARHYAKKRLPSDIDQLTEEKKAKYRATWKKEYEQAGYSNSEELARKTYDLAIRFNKTQSGLTKM